MSTTKTRICLAIALSGALYLSHDGVSNLKDLAFRFAYLLLSQYLLLAAYDIFIYPAYVSPLRHLPGPKGDNILLGQTLKFIRATNPNEPALRMMREHPNEPLLYYRHIAGSEWILINSVQAAREMLQTKCYQFEKPEFFRRIVGEIAGIGLVNVEGDVHKKQRRLLNGPLSITNVRKIVPVFNDKAEALTSTIEEKVQEGKEQAAIDISKAFTKTTLDIIGLASLGVELESLKTDGATFSELYKALLDQPPMGQLISAINMFIPCRKWLPLKANRDFLYASKEVRRLLLGIIRERRKEIFPDGAKKKTEVRKEFTEEGSKDLLTFMVYERSEGENKWSDDDILGHLMNFMSAGHDTTSGALTWATLTLCLQPVIQSRIRTEIDEKIPHGRSPTYAELESLKSMELFLKEVIRCFSPTVLVPRTPAGPNVTLCGIPIPTGTTCLLNPQTIQNNPAIWGPDATTFDLDRHSLDHPSAKSFPDSRDPYAMEAFSNGPRICIGRAFAALEFKSILVSILRQFELVRGWDENGQKLEDGVDFAGKYEKEGDVFGGVEVQNFLTLRPKDGVWVRFKPLS